MEDELVLSGDYAADLTEQQKLFCAYMLTETSAREAAVKAGYSPSTAKSQASALLNLPKYKHVQEEIAQLRAERAARLQDSADQVLLDLMQLSERAKEQGDNKTYLRCLELRARALGMIGPGSQADSAPKAEVTLKWIGSPAAVVDEVRISAPSSLPFMPAQDSGLKALPG